MLMPEAGLEDAKKAAELIRSLIESHPFEGRETQPRGVVSASFGVATLIEGIPDGNVMMDRADQALYRAKEAGRNCVRD